MPQPTNTLVTVNVRFAAEDLREYRLMALEAGKSLSAYVRDVLRAYAAERKRRRRQGLSP
jgi:hypothetical protein